MAIPRSFTPDRPIPTTTFYPTKWWTWRWRRHSMGYFYWDPLWGLDHGRLAYRRVCVTPLESTTLGRRSSIVVEVDDFTPSMGVMLRLFYFLLWLFLFSCFPLILLLSFYPCYHPSYIYFTRPWEHCSPYILSFVPFMHFLLFSYLVLYFPHHEVTLWLTSSYIYKLSSKNLFCS